MINRCPPEVILWGGTGQAKVVRPMIESAGSRVVAVFDDTPGLPPPFADIPLHCGWQAFERWMAQRAGACAGAGARAGSAAGDALGFCVAIGNPHGRVRLQLHERLADAGLQPVTIAHQTAIIADNATIGIGSQILAGAIVSVEASIGRQCIVNVRATVSHEDVLEDGVEVSPGATVCGQVHIETNAWIGAGAVVLPRLRIGADAIVGAGAVVTRDVPPRTCVVGVPAQQMTRRAWTPWTPSQLPDHGSPIAK